MSTATIIAYSATFLVSSGALNYVNNTIKSCLPEIDLKALEDISPTLATVASNASTIYNVAAFAATIYVACYAASSVTAVVAGAEALAGMNAAELAAFAPVALNNMGAPALAANVNWMVEHAGMDLVPMAGNALATIFPIHDLLNIPFVFISSSFGMAGEIIGSIAEAATIGYNALEAVMSIFDLGFPAEALDILGFIEFIE